MFIRYFKSSYLPQYLLIAFIAIILWGYKLVFPQVSVSEEFVNPGYHLIVQLFAENIYIVTAIALTILYLKAILLNNILVINDIVPKNSLIPAFVFVLFGSSSPSLISFTPLSFAILFLILSIDKMFKCYGDTASFSAVLSASLFVSIASLFFLPSLAFVVVIYLMLISFSLTNWRLWIIPLIGIILPYLYVFAYYFLSDQLSERLIDYESWWNSIGLAKFNFFSIDYAGTGLLLLFSLIAFYHYLRSIQEKNIIIRRKMVLIVFALVLTIILSVFCYGELSYIFSMIILPLAIFVSYYLGDVKTKRIHEYIIWLILICFVLLNYQIV